MWASWLSNASCTFIRALCAAQTISVRPARVYASTAGFPHQAQGGGASFGGRMSLSSLMDVSSFQGDGHLYSGQLPSFLHSASQSPQFFFSPKSPRFHSGCHGCIMHSSRFSAHSFSTRFVGRFILTVAAT